MKIIVSDYDGTLYTDEDNIKINVEMVDKFRKQGNIFIIATGRSCPSISKECEKYKLEYDYLITNHGTVILDNNKNVLKHFVIPQNIVAEILKIAESKEYIKSIKNYNTIELNNDLYNSEITTRISLISNDIEKAKELVKYINENYTNILKSYFVNPYFVEVISNSTSKANAISTLLDIKEFNNNQVYVIGDGDNDIEMVRKFNGACMDNSSKKLHSITDKQYSNVYNLIDELLN